MIICPLYCLFSLYKVISHENENIIFILLKIGCFSFSGLTSRLGLGKNRNNDRLFFSIPDPGQKNLVTAEIYTLSTKILLLDVHFQLKKFHPIFHFYCFKYNFVNVFSVSVKMIIWFIYCVLSMFSIYICCLCMATFV